MGSLQARTFLELVVQSLNTLLNKFGPRVVGITTCDPD